jgi:ribosome biogenesis protein MAK21
MKAVVAREVSALILKPTTSTPAATQGTHVRFDDVKEKDNVAKPEGTSHARYYGLITLNQITLTTRDKELASRLVELYFEVFREVLGRDPETSKPAEKGEDEEGELGLNEVEKVAGKVDKWRGRRKGAKPKGGRKSALDNEEMVESGEARLVAAVLTGINRALPFAQLDDAV